VEPGLAVGLLQLVQLNPPGGLHKYDDAPVAFNEVDEPLHIAVSVAVTATTGNGLTVIVMFVVSLHPAVSVPITVYVVVEPGLAVGLLQLVQLNPPGGLHK